MTGPLLVVGVAVQAIAWRLVALRRAPFWPVVTATWTIVGAAALLTGDARWCDRAPLEVVVVGALSGIVLYAATRIVVTFASRWRVIADAVDTTYARSVQLAPPLVWLLTLGIVVPGEELFWRGVATPLFVGLTAPVVGAILVWLASAGVAAAWSSLPFLAAAVVGGALWTALAVWSGGVLAPLTSHLVWTACMIAWRPPTASAKVAA